MVIKGCSCLLIHYPIAIPSFAAGVLLSVCQDFYCHCQIAFRLQLLLLLWCSGCAWRELRVGNALDSRRVDVVVDDNILVPVHVPRDCHVVVCVSRLSLTLSDRVVVAAVVFWLNLEGRTSW